MKRFYRPFVFVIVIAIVSITLTSGISDEISSSNGGGGKDLVEELYGQAVKQNENLQSIEEAISKFYKKKSDAMEKYNSFTYYNRRYYTDALANANSIADAATKQRALDIINKSDKDYAAKLAGWQSTITALNAKEKELNDLHTLLQIMISEPMIQKYQSTEFPDNSKANELTDDLNKVIEQIRAITK